MARTALITGGTGSFGTTMLNHLLKRGYTNVRVFSRDEEKQHNLRTRLNDDRVSFYIGDVRDKERISIALKGVQHVFHAAALKQVPSCEFFPMEAVRTNILGSENVLEACIEQGVEKVVFLSTDKAVLPINAMGMSKAMMEKVVAAKARLYHDSQTIMSMVRYGNVTGSRGSVIPLFIERILSGQPLTVTDPRMTRFLLPLPQTVALVEHAFAHARQGDLFVRKAPATNMGTLAQAMLELFRSDAGIRVIGERHGEKLYETLATAAEIRRSEDMGDYIRIPVDTRDLNYGKYFTDGEIEEDHLEDYHSHNTRQLNLEETKELLLGLPIVTEAMKRAGLAEA
ncbi:UDP-glucose 4-epimerase [Mesorhizobium sp. J18]|uniref:polysaccharide biosynthesis protein n=1 Tax=Mesorhizobium sp. J18 TaxID=935263 RepID=UPI00119AC375|nr:polysaccharide biosynthesis protein [Mesorhizobium sp. J18]TWG94773.1 UDP-glucose 4-epimerase [Mesorhizobium sp. J18]